MKPSRIKWIIALSVFCLVSIIVLQGLWLKQASVTNMVLFDQVANKALKNAVAKLEKNSIYKVMRKGFDNDSLLGEIDININTMDSSFVELETFDSANGNKRTKKSYRKKSRVIILEDEHIKSPSLKERIDSIVGDILTEIKVDSLKSDINFDVKQIDSVIKDALEQENIYSDFEFAVVDFKGDNLIKSEGFKSKTTAAVYSTSLFPLSIGTMNSKLYLQLKNRDDFLLKTLLPFALALLVFSIIISATFIISIRTILKQKKISTIKNDFINNMTHEFKTPIATISLAADALKAQPATQEQASHFADIIKQESQSMNQKVETILQMALVEQQEIKLDKEKVGASQVVKNAMQHHKLRLENLGGEITASFIEPDSTVCVDTHHMGNVVSNIIDNAIKYAGGVPVITIKMVQLKDRIVISIADKGIGMSRDEQKRVFDKFYRAESGNIHNTKGFGLGLSYASEIMKLHNGQIHIESEKGKGTTVSLTLPVENEN